jgi:hypothetical protein
MGPARMGRGPTIVLTLQKFGGAMALVAVGAT